MSVKRVMGIETEYGISCPLNTQANPMFLSSLVVGAYSEKIYPNHKLRWDYDLESPLRDARGFDASRAEADPSLLTDNDATTNVILKNGARFYVDHAHPEYSSPEVISPQEAVLWDKAGAAIIQEAANLAARSNPDGEIYIYKNNTDNKSVSYGTHENYLVDRAVAFSDLVKVLTPFFVTRQIYTGSGRLGVGVLDREYKYQISQRADFFETLVGLETTMRRPIINTRDEPHADPQKYRRLHVIIGDANLSELANLVKMGATSLVLAMIEADQFNQFNYELADPLLSLREVSQDLNLSIPLKLKNGKTITALQMQQEIFNQISDWTQKTCPDDPETSQVIYWWGHFLEYLQKDKFKLANSIDWIAKYKILQELKDRDNLSWRDPILQMIDLQYSDLNPDRGIALLLERRGSLIKLTDDQAVERAKEYPPATTRAWFRGQALINFPNQVAAASWDSIIFDVAADRPLVRIPTLDPLKGTQDELGDIFDKSQDVTTLIAHLGAN
jgi:Pup amidohydrolase